MRILLAMKFGKSLFLGFMGLATFVAIGGFMSLMQLYKATEPGADVESILSQSNLMIIIFVSTITATAIILAIKFSKIFNKLERKINDDSQEMKALNDEISFQNMELSNQLTKISKIEKQKEEFTTMMTHEFKTPLTPILMQTQLLSSKMLGDISEKQENALKKIESNTKSLSQLITDMLDAQKLDLNELPFNKTKCNSKDIISELIENYKPIMNDKNIKIISSQNDDVSLISDKNRIKQAIQIFITNALDFVAEKDGIIDIKSNEKEDHVVFSVIDNGVGISKENQEKLFHKFYQVDSTVTRRHGGSGLGLAIVKGISKALGGSTGVKSEVNKGSEFFIKIPKTTITKSIK